MKKTIPLIIGICGGSGSGKTTFSRQILKTLGEDHCSILAQDSYYHDIKNVFDHDGGQFNFDHPSSIDFELMAKHLEMLKLGMSVDVPVYDFSVHGRKDYFEQTVPKSVILVEGILILSQENIRKNLDFSVFFDIDEETRFTRRLRRDVMERGRTEEGVYRQFYSQVKPMHELFVAPSVHFARYVVKDNRENEHCLNRIFEEFLYPKKIFKI